MWIYLYSPSWGVHDCLENSQLINSPLPSYTERILRIKNYCGNQPGCVRLLISVATFGDPSFLDTICSVSEAYPSGRRQPLRPVTDCNMGFQWPSDTRPHGDVRRPESACSSSEPSFLLGSKPPSMVQASRGAIYYMASQQWWDQVFAHCSSPRSKHRCQVFIISQHTAAKRPLRSLQTTSSHNLWVAWRRTSWFLIGFAWARKSPTFRASRLHTTTERLSTIALSSSTHISQGVACPSEKCLGYIYNKEPSWPGTWSRSCIFISERRHHVS